jgi:methyl-accepting chemotaxis protein
MPEPARTHDRLNERLDFMGLDARAREALQKLQPLIGRAIGPALTIFYDKVKANPEARKFFTDERHMMTAKGLQERHWATISAAEFTQDYVDRVRKIGQAHARVGLALQLQF